MNKLNTKYFRLEFQNKRFRLLNGEIISKMPLRKFTLIILFKKVPEQSGNNYDIISSVGSQKLVSLIFAFFRRDKKLNNICYECPILLKDRQDYN